MFCNLENNLQNLLYFHKGKDVALQKSITVRTVTIKDRTNLTSNKDGQKCRSATTVRLVKQSIQLSTAGLQFPT